MKCLVICVVFLFVATSDGFVIEHAKKLSDRLKIMLRCPKYEYSNKLRKYLNLYTGVVSFLVLKAEEGSVDPAVEQLYRQGMPSFLSEPLEEHRPGFKKALRWTDRDLDIFVDEFKDAKIIWAELEKQIKSKTDVLPSTR